MAALSGGEDPGGAVGGVWGSSDDDQQLEAGAGEACGLAVRARQQGARRPAGRERNRTRFCVSPTFRGVTGIARARLVSGARVNEPVHRSDPDPPQHGRHRSLRRDHRRRRDVDRGRERTLLRDGMAGCRRPLCARDRNWSHRLCQDAMSARRYCAGEARCSAVDAEPARQASVSVSTPLTTFPGENRMIGKSLALAGALLLSTQVYAQTNQNSPGPAQGVTSARRQARRRAWLRRRPARSRPSTSGRRFTSRANRCATKLSRPRATTMTKPERPGPVCPATPRRRDRKTRSALDHNGHPPRKR